MMRQRMTRLGSGILRRLLLVLCLAGILTGGLTYAKGSRTVRVAFFPMDGYHMIDRNGSFGGMDVDYLNVLCRYANWNIAYVVCESWDDALAKLEAHEVDLVGSAQYSAARAETFDYADLASGYTFGMIATNADGTIAYEDFDAMRDITYGMVKSYVRRAEFYAYLEANGIDEPHVVEYDNTQLLQDALNAGEIDALVHTFMEVKDGQRLIGRFAPKPIYYITWKGNQAVLRELNAAIADLKFNHPELETDLMSTYYESKLDKSVLLTTEEKEYLKQKKELTIGYLDDHYPFSYTHPETGEFAGLSRNLLEEGLLWTGVEIHYRRFANDEEAHAALAAGEVDLQAYCVQPAGMADEEGLKSVHTYANIPLVLVTEGGLRLDDIHTLATIAGFSDRIDRVDGFTPSELCIQHSQKACLDLLVDGQADAVLCDGYLAENQLRTVWQYQNLKITMVLNVDHSVHMLIRGGEDPALERILSKNLSTVDMKEINEYTFEKNTYPLMTLNTFVRNNSLVIVAALLLLIAVIILVSVHFVRDSRRIQRLMYKDPTMDVWNMNYLYYMGEERLQTDKRERYAIVCINISNMRRYNIIYGWEAGQQLLEITKDTLEKCVDDKKEICARHFADRFVLFLTWQDWRMLLERLERIQQIIENIIFNQTESRMLISMGVYAIPPQEKNLRKAVNCANQAMALKGDKYHNRIIVYDEPVEAMITERYEREKVLDAVDISQDFVVYYQNKVDIRTEEIVGAEALVRFQDPTANGMVRSPAYFIPYYEQTGRIEELDFFVLESVCKMLRKRMDEGKQNVPISVNFSRMHFDKPGFPERFEAVLEKYRIDKCLVEVEITETLVMEELEQNIIKETLQVMKEKGIRLSIDDFGAGYSSLGAFVHVPASVIKLDRSFLLNHENRVRQLKIMHGIVRMSNDLEAQIVCEGVETETDLELMRNIEAYVAQGYYYSKPVPQHEFEAKLDAQ